MSFDNEVLCLVHLVTFPSVWLPPRDTIKIMVVGAQEQRMNDLVDQAQTSWPNVNWAFYYVPDFDLYNQEHVDWTVVNSLHMHGKLAFVDNLQNLAVSQSLTDTIVLEDSCDDSVYKLLSVQKTPVCDLSSALNHILKQAGKISTP